MKKKKICSLILCVCMMFSVFTETFAVATDTSVTAYSYLSGINGLNYVRSIELDDIEEPEYTVTNRSIEMYDALALYLLNSGNWEKMIKPVREALKNECVFEYTSTDEYGDTEYYYFVPETPLITKCYTILGETASQKMINESGIIYVLCERITEIPEDSTTVTAKRYLSDINGLSYIRSLQLEDTETTEYTIINRSYEMYDALGLYLSNNGNWLKMIKPIREALKKQCITEYTNTDVYGDKEYYYIIDETSLVAKRYTILGETASQKMINESGLIYILCERFIQKPKNFTNLTFESSSLTYDGTEKGLVVNGKIPAGATVTYTSEDFDADGKAIDAGTYNITATVKKEGYNDWVKEATLTITPKGITVTGLTVNEKVYDGTKNAIILGGALNGVVSGDDVTAIYPKTGTFAKADVGTEIPVETEDVVLSGADKNNYELTQPTTLKGNIKKAALKVKAEDKNIVKGSAIPELTYTITEGQLYGGDTLTGALTTKANGTKVGTFDITQGTLKASSNYTLNFTKGCLTVVDKTSQNVSVDGIVTEKTYGDDGFKITVTPDLISNLDNFEFASSDTNVATIDADGNVTIKNAGSTTVSVKEPGNADYAPFEKTWILTVNKVNIIVSADTKSKRVGTIDPELTYTYTGTLVGTDAFTGELLRKAGEEIGQYDILIGTLTISSNYDIKYNKAIFEIVDKTPQNITVSEITEKTYGDGTFTVTVTPDSISQLDKFTFESSNTDVAEITSDGIVTIKSVGETDITVKQDGNDEYAAVENVQKLVVNKKAITISSINGDEKTSVFEGVLESDIEAVSLDYGKLNIIIGDAVSETTSGVTFNNFELIGDKSANYTIATQSVVGVLSNENIVDVAITAKNGVITGAGKYIKGSAVTVTATPNSGYKFGGWYIDETAITKESTYSFAAESDTLLIAKFDKRSSGGGGGASVSNYTVTFETNGGNKIDALTVENNKVIKVPEAPAKEGYIFDGWFTDKKLTKAYNFATKVTKNFTLYAKWVEVTDEEPVVSNEFTDVDETDWFYGNVQYVVENNLMSGVGDNKFAPDVTLTRAMLVTVLYRNEGEPATNTSIPFADIDMGAYYVNAVSWAKQNDIVSGVSENEFAPDANITREQIATIMFRYAQYKGMDTATLEENLYFTDSSEISQFAVSAMNWAVGTGLMMGKSDTKIKPKDNATRAELAAILQRFIKNN